MVKEFFSKLVHHWKVLLKDRAYVISLLMGFAVLFGAVVVNEFASTFKDASTYAPVGDLLLDGLPTYNLEFLFTWGFYGVLLAIIFYPLIFKPEIAPFVLKTFGILLLARSAFMILTNFGPPEGFFYNQEILINGAIESSSIFRYRNDLFFSGHTSTPFLAFLLFKNTKFKWFMLLASFVMAATVLLMHVHYSIDVFAAYFIAYGVYAFSDKVFNNLNLRFKNKIRIHGWKAFQERIIKLRERRALKKAEKVKEKQALINNSV